MATSHRISNLLRCAILLTPLTVGCGDDDGPDDVGNDAAADSDAARVDATTPDATAVGDAGATGDASSTPDAEADSAVPPSADTWAVTSSGRLLRFARGNGSVAAAVNLTGIPAGETLLGADIRPANGTVVALVRVDGSSAGKLYTVDPATGVATFKATLALDPGDSSEPFAALAGSNFGVDFNPVADRLRVISDSGQNLRINPETGATITDTALTPATPGVYAAAYTESFGAACRTRLFVIDASSRKLLLQDPPNDGRLTEVATLGDTTGVVHGFDIQTLDTGSNVAIFAATASDGERVGSFDLVTGALGASAVVPLTAGETLRAVFADLPTSTPAQARGELLATTASNKLISFNRTAPGKLCSSVAITNLADGESVLGADVRPADKALYALGSTGKLYTVALDTGAATLKSTLSAATGDDDPFVSLAAGEYGVGFNPAADRLRVVTGDGANLRINVDDGKVTTDALLSNGSAVSAAAYTNSFAGTKSTALYGLDHGADALVRIGSVPADAAACPNDTNPNCGVVTTIGPLSAGGDVTDVNGFDIDANTGTALAALRLGDAASSTLFAVNLTTGAAALPTGTANGTIGGGEPVRSLTFAAAPTLTAWVATSDGKLLSFAPATPGTITKTLTLSGLQADETLIGIDVRPLDGTLYGIGSSGRLYSLDLETGAASLTAQLSAALPSSSYGFDFNPAADALRLVDLAADNFRILPSGRLAGATGTVFTDTALTPADADISAAAYTNNFVGASSTTLYVLDGVNGRLLRQGGANGEPSPNGGVLTEIGATGVSSAGGANFDIVGGNNGLALAVLTALDNTSSLYVINLGSGVATAYNATANSIAGASAPLRGLALTLR